MTKLVGREIKVKRGRLVENMIISEITQIVPNVFSVSGTNSKRKIVVTMMEDEILENLLGGN